MKVNPIIDVLEGEHIVGVHPTMSPDARANWHRRLNLYTGRALSDIALTAAQEGSAGRLATQGQTVSPGVVSGLEVVVDSQPLLDKDGQNVVDTETGATLLRSFYNIASGFGIDANGEDVLVPNPLRLDAKSIPVYAPSRLLDNAELPGEAAPEEPIGGEETGPTPSSRPLAVRRAGRSLGDLIADRIAIPRVGVLVLQPIVAELIDRFDPTDPCEQDPDNYAFEDWQKADGSRLLFYTWPNDWVPLLTTDNRWRNRLAYAIFNAERRNQPNELLPWEEVGVPIALVAFDASWNIAFVDRHSVVRDGGGPKRRTMFIPKSGNPYLWQARLKQFAEQLAETNTDDLKMAEVAAQFRYLPPIGVLPREAVQLLSSDDAQNSRVGRSNFFPAGYQIDVAPIPLEQLDVAMKAGASLAPFDQDTSDSVQVFVPVPEVWFEPELLKVKTVAPEFQKEIDRLNTSIADSLQSRKDVRRKHRAISRSITGKDPIYVEADPPEDVPLKSAEDEFGTTPKLNQDGQPALGEDGKPVLAVTMIENLRLQLKNNPALSDDERAQLDERGLQEFITFLEATVDRASDRIDFGFLRIQTDIYRTRQLVLSNVAATRLATSPVLASIAKGESAIATKEDIESFLTAAKGKLTARPPAPPAGPLAVIGTLAALSGAERFVVEKSALPLADVSNSSISNFAGLVSIGTRVNLPVTSRIATTTIAELSPKSQIAAITAQAAGRVVELAPRPIDIEQRIPVIGQAFVPRTVTIADRIEDPKAPESKNYSVASKFEIIKSLGETGITMDDIVIPGVLVLDANGIASVDPTTRLARREAKTFGEIKNQLDKRILGDPTDATLDEAKIFSIGVELLEHAISVLRATEARIQAYKTIIGLCRTALTDTNALLSKAEQRLAVLEHALAEARHDLTIAQALLVDEQERVHRINERRDLIVKDHVPFLAYQRERLVDLNVQTPTRTLDPAITESPVPACLGHDATIPSDLRATVALFRESPIKWFPNIDPLLDRLDRIEMLQETMISAKQRALANVSSFVTSAQQITAPTRGGVAIQQAFFAQREVITQFQQRTSQLDLSLLANQGWRFVRDQAKENVSLGDMIDAGHGRTDVAQQAARELESISGVAGCLYTKFGEVLPVIRLEWVEAFSQYDTPVNLRNLAVLPRWHEVEFLDRREMQTFVDWLYQRIDALQPQAVSLVNDLIRICLLLASHAPVNQIIAGHVPKATPVQVGGHVEVAVDHTKIRVGMSVMMYSLKNELVARGVVEDLLAGKAATRVVTAVAKSVNLDAGARVHFAESRAFERSTLTSRAVFR